jgi:hypothetical protein
MEPLSKTQQTALKDWAEVAARSWYAVNPETQYVRGIGMLPDVRDLALGIVLPLLKSLNLRAIYRDHDDALLALRRDRELQDTLSVFPRARLIQIVRTIVAALPTPANDEVAQAIKLLKESLPDSYLLDAVTFALDQLATTHPVLDGERVRTTPVRPKSKSSSFSKRQEHLRVFLASVPPGTHSTVEVFTQYQRSAARSGIKPIGRTNFFRSADLHFGPRVRSSSNAFYRVIPPTVEQLNLDVATVLGFRPLGPRGDAKELLLSAAKRSDAHDESRGTQGSPPRAVNSDSSF